MRLRFLKKHRWIILIFLLGLILRTWKLAELPSGFHVDEVKVGWNAYSILKTGADDWGHKFPLYYNSFGDFRPTGYFYLTIPSILIFGLNEFAVRLPGALFGSLTIIIAFLLVRELSGSNRLIARLRQQPRAHLSLFTAIMLALSPWHISLSRATSEGIIALFLALTGLWLYIKCIKKPSFYLCLFSLLFLLLSYFFYHSARLLVPMLVFITIAFFWWNSRPRPTLRDLPKSHFKLPLFLLFSVSLVTLLFALDPAARGRFNQVSIFKDLDVRYELDKMPFEEGPGHVFEARLFHNKPSVYTRRFINEYTQYISSKFFLAPKEGQPARYMTSGIGVLTYVEFFLLVAGLVAIAQRKSYTSLLVLGLLLLTPLPAALTTEDSPNMHRALFMLPFLATIEAYGAYQVFRINSRLPIRLLISIAFLANFIYFFHQYFVHNPVSTPLYRNAGAKELALKLSNAQSGYDKIIFTEIPDSPYPWIAFWGKFDPSIFNQKAKTRDKGVWSFNKYIFSSQRCPSRDAFNDQGKLLVVDADACEAGNPPNGAHILDQIKRPDGTVVYTLWARD
ncbi:MAG: glycosyltransferase family 39 protein [Candidatus Blackburnbacteria bacterium]|nr:glycosyltransferase family 39 protein [Candidatus Blackburnbacteria bacterium]